MNYLRTEGGHFQFKTFIFNSYSQNPSYGNAAEVEEDLLKQKNELRVKEWLCSVAKEQVGLTELQTVTWKNAPG